MAFARPTLEQLVDRIQSDFVSRLSLAGAVLRRSVVFVLARALAGAAHMLHGHLDYLSRQIFPDTSEVEYLERQASLYGLQRKAADFAAGIVTFLGIDGAVIPNGTVLQRADGTQYTSTAQQIVASSAAAVPVQATVAGEGSNADIGVSLALVSPISSVAAQGTVASPGIAGGTDQEPDDELRARLSERMQAPPLGGAIHDYIRWAKEVPGVTRVWVYPLEDGDGTLTVRFVCDDLDPIIPDSDKVTEVQDHIDPLRPVTAILTVAAPVPDTLNFTMAISPATDAVKAAVEAELRDLLKREASPGGTILLSHIREAISIAAGENDYTLTSPAANVVSAAGHMPVFGTITWS